MKAPAKPALHPVSDGYLNELAIGLQDLLCFSMRVGVPICGDVILICFRSLIVVMSGIAGQKKKTGVYFISNSATEKLMGNFRLVMLRGNIVVLKGSRDQLR